MSMKIKEPVEIIKGRLYAFHYEKDSCNILRLMLQKWNDTQELHTFFKTNKKYFDDGDFFPINYNIHDFNDDIENDLSEIETFLEKAEKEQTNLEDYFIPLSKAESDERILTLTKRRSKLLRLYAIKIDENLYVITGGAIKLSKKTQDHKGTNYEISKLDFIRSYLKHIGIETKDHFIGYFNL